MMLKPFARRLAVAALTASACAALGGCGVTRAVGGVFSGGDSGVNPNAPPRAERIPILTAEQVLSVEETTMGPATLPAPYVNASWPQTGGSANHAMQHPDGAARLSRVWRRSVGAGDGRNSRITAQPVVEGGRIFVMDGRGVVGAYDAAAGRELWRRTLRVANERDQHGFGGGVAVGEGRVYVSGGAGLMAALDAETGEELWRLETLVPMHSAPAVSGGRVFAVTKDNVLIAADAATGARVWSFQAIADPARVMTSPAPAVADDLVIAPFGSGELWAVQAVTGQPVWQDALTRAGQLAPIATLNDLAGSPVVYDGVIYAMSHSGVLAAVSLASGERQWALPVGGVHMPWLAGDYLFVMSTDAQLIAIDRREGSVRWLIDLPGFRNMDDRKGKISWAGPALIGGKLAVVSSRGEGRFYDAETGALIGNFEAGDTFVSPVVADRTLYVLDGKGDLSAYR